MTTVITEIIPDLLWQGDISALEADWQLQKLGIVQIASIIDYKPKPPDRYHHIYLEAEDGSKLPAEEIHDFCKRAIRMKTYLHCYSGHNRSTAMACCCRVLHTFDVPMSLLYVLVKRNTQLAKLRDGSVTNMTWQMMDNVKQYIDFLKKEGMGQ